LDRWVTLSKAARTFDGLSDILLREQFAQATCIVFERKKPNPDVDEMVRLAEQYLAAHADMVLILW
jgi:hypothetical protein